MPHKLRKTPKYRSAKADLNENGRVGLRYVEAGIAADPYHRVARFAYPEGIVVDYSADDLLVGYWVVDSETVELLEVADSQNPPPWYK